ncbi:MAG: tRNA lysidine(34) synthetase TilS [Bacteroidetes bacterium GWA2_31_9]|nr:MAG: tRNA lysidine(34) synthetase TilS [Bacteroidetes bacterium GWA2_31_9]
MINQFNNYIYHNNLCQSEDKLILAVSGGIDSVSMLHLFIESDYKNLSVAHCNFSLRGSESDGDEAFVKNLADKNNIQFYTIRFDTQQYACENGISIQMAARELRYNWFNKLLNEQNAKYIAIAHNSDDNVETFLLNISRGTGLKGLTGIKPKNHNIIRPLLFTSREMIVNYCSEKNIEYRTDSSNSENHYQRNNLRNNVIPLLKTRFPEFSNNILCNIQKFAEINLVFENYIQQIKNELFIINENIVEISISKLSGYQPLPTILYELLKEFGFNIEIVNETIEALNGNPGKTFYSSTHRLIKDREKLIITSIPHNHNQVYYIDLDSENEKLPIEINFEIVENNENFNIVRSNNLAYFDAEKILFPLILRKWQHGDYFMPFGMTNFKKISDFFTDNKLSLNEKENVWLLCNGNEIIWVVGMRSDNRFRISDETKKILIVKTV